MSSYSHHDWLSQEYVDEWIARDMQRDAERRPNLREMISLAPFARDAEIRVLDVGGGYGVVTEEVLGVFPRASMVLQDYSEVMMGHARRRLSRYGDQVTFIHADLLDASWVVSVGGPFDLAVSSIALHNLDDLAAIADCYRGIRNVLEGGGLFVNYDLFDHAGGITEHVKLLKNAGFTRVECKWQKPPAAILAARP